MMTKITNNSVTNLIITVIGTPLIIGFLFWLLLKPWFKLSPIYSSKLPPEKILFEYQSCLLDKTRIKGNLNIGITKQELYLSLTSPLNYFISPLLISWDAITKIEPYFDESWGNCYRFFIGKPTITTIVLTEEIVEKIQSESGRLLI